MFLTNWLRPRSAKNPQRPAPRPRARLGVQQLEDRTVPSFLGQIGGAGTDSLGLGTQTMDSLGNSYLAGSFDQAADIDPGSGTTILVPQGTGNDEFIAKYTPDGALAWAKRFGGGLGDIGMNSMAVDSSGNTYVSGYFTGTADFGNNIVLTATSKDYLYGNGYVMKLDPSGSTVWVRTVGVGTSGHSTAVAIAVDGNSVFATGSFSGQADFDPSHSYRDNHDLLTSTGKGKTTQTDAFVWRLTTDGGFVSAWGFGGKDNDAGQSIFAANGSIYVVGSFRGTADFDPSPTSTAYQTSTTSGSNTYSNLFVASYTPDTAGGLRLNWVQTAGGNGSQGPCWKVAGDATSLYVPGIFAGTVDFDRNNGTSTGQDTLTSVAGSIDAFVAKYDLSDGSLAWVRGIGGPGADTAGGSMVVTDAGMIYVGGHFSQTVDFDPAHAYPDNRDLLTTKGGTDGYICQLKSDGAYVNAWRMGGAGNDTQSRPIGVYGGRLYVTGSFQQTADFPTGGTLTSFGAEDIFLMALDLPTPQIGSFTASPNPTAGSPVTLTASGVQALNPGGTITQVAFYADSNGDGVLDSNDTLLGYGTPTADGTWAFTYTFSTAGTYKLFAQAKDSYGDLSDPLALDLEVL